MGMIKVPHEAVDFFRSNLDGIVESGNLAEGEWNTKLNQFFSEYSNTKHAVSFCSNGAGITSVLAVLKTYYGAKRICIQSNTMYGMKTTAITSGLEYVGAVSCNLDTLMPSFQQFREFYDGLADHKGLVFLISHIGGIVNPDIDKISLFCKANDVYLIEDCAHSVGSKLRGKSAGSFGLAGVYSLYSTKSIMAGEGGVVITDDDQLYNLVSRFNIYDRFEMKMDIGVNFRISEIQALFSYAICRESEAIIRNKIAIADRYSSMLDTFGVRYINQIGNGHRGNYYKFILLNPLDDSRFDQITMRTSPVYSYSLGADPQKISSRHICLPIWYEFEESNIELVCEQLKLAFG